MRKRRKWEKPSQPEEVNQIIELDKMINEQKRQLVEPYLRLQILDPAMGSGHFLVGAADFLSLAMATDQNILPLEEMSGDPQAFYKRLVVEQCLYGVDLNPLAVELAKLSLWLHTVSHNKALSFLDHHLRYGNSLIGTHIEDDLSTTPPEIDARGRVRNRNTAQMVLGFTETLTSRHLQFFLDTFRKIVELMPGDAENERMKDRLYREMDARREKFRAVANCWLAPYFGAEVSPEQYQSAVAALRAETDAAWKLVSEEVWFSGAQSIAREKQFFHWELEFPELFFNLDGLKPRNGRGFDAVIGNPPYVNMDRVESSQSKYLKYVYPDIWMGQSDYFYFFITRGVDISKDEGRLGYITARYFMEAFFAAGFRQFMLDNTKIMRVVDFQNYTVFKDVGTKTCLLLLQKQSDKDKRVSNESIIYRLPDRRTSDREIEASLASSVSPSPFETVEFNQNQLSSDRWLFPRTEEKGLTTKINNKSWLLREKCRVGMGMQTGANDVFEVSLEEIRKYEIEPQVLKKVVSNMEIQRYIVEFNDRYWIYTEPYGEEAPKLFPKTMKYLKEYRDRLEKRIAFKRGDCKWYQFSYPRHVDKYDSPKLIVPFIAPFNRFALDQFGKIYSSTDSQVIFPLTDLTVKLEYIAALLNSTLLNWLHIRLGKIKDYRYEYSKESISALPIRSIEFNTPTNERTRLAEKGQQLYERCLEADDYACVLGMVEHELAQKPERSDVVHDLLAFLAQRMIEMNEQKQAEVKGFLAWLERKIGARIDDLSNKTRLRTYHEGSLDALIAVLVQNRRKLKINPDTRAEQENIKREFNESMGKLAPLKKQVMTTDSLINLVVYKLYGLSEDEIALIKGSLSSATSREIMESED